jgi:hypothetical protein
VNHADARPYLPPLQKVLPERFSDLGEGWGYLAFYVGVFGGHGAGSWKEVFFSEEKKQKTFAPLSRP